VFQTVKKELIKLWRKWQIYKALKAKKEAQILEE